MGRLAVNKTAIIIYIVIGCTLIIVAGLCTPPPVRSQETVVSVSSPVKITPGGSQEVLSSPAEQPAPSGLLFEAIGWVESKNNDKAVGDSGQSKGRFQCGKMAWIDACEYGGLDWDYDTYVWSAPHCREIMKLYWARYKATTDELRCKIWNGGPRGMQKQSTEKYWQKVKNYMDERTN